MVNNLFQIVEPRIGIINILIGVIGMASFYAGPMHTPQAWHLPTRFFHTRRAAIVIVNPPERTHEFARLRRRWITDPHRYKSGNRRYAPDTIAGGGAFSIPYGGRQVA